MTGVRSGSLLVEVSGGARGSAATYEALHRCAGVLSEAGAGALDLAARVVRCASDPALLLSSALAPVPAARVQAALAALAEQLVAAGLRLQTHAAAVVAAVAAYRAADRLATRPGEAHPPERVPQRLALPAVPAEPGEPPGSAAGALPEQALLRGLPLLDGVLDVVDVLWPGGVGGAAALVASLYPPGRGGAGAARRSAVRPGTAPRSVGDLVAALAVRERASTGVRQGEVELLRVRTTARGGVTSTAWVVLLPGTRDWQLDPRRRPYLSDLRTNLDLVSGTTSARLDGLDAALHRAGVRSREPVMLVGHSQGGLLAAAAAQRWAADGSRRITHVLTTGAPTGRADLPSAVRVLALESRYDPVPRLDGARAPALAHWTTAVLDDGRRPAGVGAAHSLQRVYLPGARALGNGSGAGSVRAWVDGADAFLAEADELVEVRRTVVEVRNLDARTSGARGGPPGTG